MKTIGALVFLPIVLAFAFVANCAMSWDDIPDQAAPSGFKQVAHDWTCTGNGECWTFLDYGCDGYCYHDWLFVSDSKTYADVIDEMTLRHSDEKWSVKACGSLGEPTEENPCFLVFVAGPTHYEECIVYQDFKRDSKWREEMYDAHREAIAGSRTALLVTTSCG